MQRITLAGATGVMAIGEPVPGGCQKITYHIKGFTCITCAVGLEVMLRQQRGVIRAQASYPKATVLIEFDPRQVNENSLKGRIAELGFTAEKERSY